jgi:hypothetical protein
MHDFNTPTHFCLFLVQAIQGSCSKIQFKTCKLQTFCMQTLCVPTLAVETKLSFLNSNAVGKIRWLCYLVILSTFDNSCLDGTPRTWIQCRTSIHTSFDNRFCKFKSLLHCLIYKSKKWTINFCIYLCNINLFNPKEKFFESQDKLLNKQQRWRHVSLKIYSILYPSQNVLFSASEWMESSS